MKKKLGWSDIKKIGTTDKGGRWYPVDALQSYFDHYRSPSRAWPNSYAKAAQTFKFAEWLIENHEETARRLELISEDKK